MIHDSAPTTTNDVDGIGSRSESIGSDRPARGIGSAETTVSGDLSEAEQAVRRDPDLLARIESVLDDPSVAVPLDEFDETASSDTTAANSADTPSGCREP